MGYINAVFSRAPIIKYMLCIVMIIVGFLDARPGFEDCLRYYVLQANYTTVLGLITKNSAADFKSPLTYTTYRYTTKLGVEKSGSIYQWNTGNGYVEGAIISVRYSNANESISIPGEAQGSFIIASAYRAGLGLLMMLMFGFIFFKMCIRVIFLRH